MIYETYETDAFVLSAHNVGEGNRFFYLFTKEFGLVKATAQSVRVEKSKLRYNLQPFSRAQVSLVRGKEQWRVVGAEGAQHFFVSFSGNTEAQQLLRHLFDLVIRLVHGEGVHPYTFDTLGEVSGVLLRGDVTKEDLKPLELISVARILFELGYFSPKEYAAHIFEDTRFSHDTLLSITTNREMLVRDINASLEETHL